MILRKPKWSFNFVSFNFINIENELSSSIKYHEMTDTYAKLESKKVILLHTVIWLWFRFILKVCESSKN